MNDTALAKVGNVPNVTAYASTRNGVNTSPRNSPAKSAGANGPENKTVTRGQFIFEAFGVACVIAIWLSYWVALPY